MSARIYHWLLLTIYLASVFLLALQPLRAAISPDYGGILPYRGIDESLYLNRLQEGLIDPSADTTGGLWTSPSSPSGIQASGMERFAGWMFGWTGMRAPEVALLLTIFLAPLGFVLSTAMARSLGLSRTSSLMAGLLFFFFTGFLRRYFNPSWSMPLMMMALWLLFDWWRSPRWWNACLAGFILGLLPDVYFWAWTYGWVFFGVLMLSIFVQRKSPLFRKRWKTALFGIVVMLMTASPFLWHIFQMQQRPLFPEVAVRMGLIMSRHIESFPRSIVLLALAAGVAWSLRSQDERERFMPLTTLTLTSFIVQHQQLLHGRVLSFSSHYYMYHCLVAALVLVTIFSMRKWGSSHFIAMGASLLLLGGGFVDYHGRHTLLAAPSASSRRFESLGPVISLLESDPRETVLTDHETANIVASNTNDDVIYTDYARILLISTQELAERFCLTEAFSRKSPQELATYFADFQKEHSRAGAEQTEALFKKHRSLILERCPYVRSHVPEMLTKYGVTTLLWNTSEAPGWIIPDELFKVRGQGEGWVLYDRVDSGKLKVEKE